MAGLTDSNAFPVTVGAFQTTNRGGGDGFVTKLDNTGVIVYSTYLGGSSGESIRGIAVDSVGSAYVTGTTQSTLGPPNYPSQVPFPTTVGAFQTMGDGGGQDVFVTKLNPAGSALVYSTLLTGNSYDQGWAIAVDAGGNAYVCGFTHSTDFPVTAGAYQSTLAGIYNVFLTKLNPSGSAPVYSTLLGGNNTDLCVSVAIDGFGSAYIAGKTSSSTFPTTAGVLQGTNPGQSTNAFVAKLNSRGTQLVYGGYLGGSQGYATAIAVGSDGAALVTGYGSVIFPTTFDELLPRRGYPFLSKLNRDATAFIYSTRFGGSGVDVATGIALDSKGSAYVTGYTQSTDFRTTAGALQTSSGGGRDAFVAKFSFPVCRRPVRVIPDTGAFIRYLQGITGIALMAGLYPDAEVTPVNAAAKIADFNENAGAYDFDGDSKLDALVDGLLYMRYALGNLGSALVANLNVGSIRTISQIETALAACK